MATGRFSDHQFFHVLFHLSLSLHHISTAIDYSSSFLTAIVGIGFIESKLQKESVISQFPVSSNKSLNGLVK